MDTKPALSLMMRFELLLFVKMKTIFGDKFSGLIKGSFIYNNLNNYFLLFISLLLSWTILGAAPFFQLGGLWPQTESQILFLRISWCFILSGRY